MADFNVNNLLTGRQPIQTANPIAPSLVLPKVQRTFYRNEGSRAVYDNFGHEYKDPQEFFNAGGKWENVQTKKAVPNLTSLFPKPTPQPQQPEQSPFRFVPKIAQALDTASSFLTNPAVGLAKLVGQSKTGQDAFKSMAQGSVRNAISVGESLIDPNKFDGKSQEFTPKTGFAKALTGTDQPIATIDRRLTEAQQQVLNSNKTLNFINPKLDEKGKARSALLIGALGVGANSTSDFFGFGGEEKAAMKALVEAKDIATTTGILKKLGIADEVASKFAPKFAEITKPEEVSQLFKEIKNPSNRIVQKLTDLKEKYIPSGSLADKSLKLKTEFIDRLAPLEDLLKGKKISPESNPYIAARNYAGHVGKIESRLEELRNILKPAGKDLPTAMRYSQLEREIEQASHGINKFEGGRTLDEIKAEKAAIDNSPEGVSVRTLADQIRGVTDKNLQEMRDGGIISKEAFDAARKNNEKYTPFYRAEKIADNIDHIPRGSNAFSVASQDVFKQAAGSTKEIVNPLESIVKQIAKTTSLVERNKVAQKVADLTKNPEFDGLVKKIEGVGVLPKNFDKFSVLRNGIKEDYAAPKVVVDAMKGLDEKAVDLITTWVGKTSSKALRSGATTYNPLFIPSNIIRDYQTARLASPVGFNVTDWVKGFAGAISKDKDFKAFLEAGGGSGYFEGTKNLPKTVKELSRSTNSKIIRTVLNPIELLKIPGQIIKKAGEITEAAPRLGVFKRSLKQGAGEAEAAFNARNATVDFSKYGNSMKLANAWIPFLNARLQGTLNVGVGLAKGFKEKPLQTAWKLSTIVGLPVVATYLNNTQRFPEIYKDISEADKRNNFILIFGDKLDDKGNPTQVVKIPKGETKVLANPLEAFLDHLSHNDPKSLKQLAVEMASDASPIGFDKNGELSGGAVGSSVLPPTIKGGVESLTNKNLYTGYDIVPQSMKDTTPKEQYDDKTSALAKELGKVLNWSPKKIDNFITTQFGGVGRQVTSPESIGTQFKSRFIGARGGQQEQNLQDEAQKALQDQADKKLELKRHAKTVLDDLETMPKESAAKFFESLPNDLKQEVVDQKEKKDLGFTGKDYVIDQLGVENGERAKFIKAQFDKLSSDKEKAALWDDLVRKKLISKNVADQIGTLIKLNP